MPFAGYKNFADCVKKNSGKGDPKAYCATIMRAAEEEAMDTQVHELIDAQEATFSTDESGKMHGKIAIIKAGRAKSKPRNYRASALQKAAKEGIYDGLLMFVNHSDKPPLKRDFREAVAAIESTEWDAKGQRVLGNVEFFDKEFFDRVQAARKYVGVSADHQIQVTYAQEGQEKIQHVTAIPMARSVDWVLYPAAGGELLSFAKESEGAEQVEWSDITAETLKENAPQLYAELIKVKEEQEPPKDPDEDPKDEEAKPLTAVQIQQMIADGIATGLTKAQESQATKADVQEKIRQRLSKSGLHTRVQARLLGTFTGATTYDEKQVDATVEEAKEELKEIGLRGPRIGGMGMSSNTGGEPGERTVISARESVEAFFLGDTKKRVDDKNASQKES